MGASNMSLIDENFCTYPKGGNYGGNNFTNIPQKSSNIIGGSILGM
jgi:hypothetical protein